MVFSVTPGLLSRATSICRCTIYITPWPSKSLIHSTLKTFTSTLFEPHSLLTKICNLATPGTLRPPAPPPSRHNLLCPLTPAESVFKLIMTPTLSCSPSSQPVRALTLQLPGTTTQKNTVRQIHPTFPQLDSPDPPNLYPTLLKPPGSPGLHTYKQNNDFFEKTLFGHCILQVIPHFSFLLLTKINEYMSFCSPLRPHTPLLPLTTILKLFTHK